MVLSFDGNFRRSNHQLDLLSELRLLKMNCNIFRSLRFHQSDFVDYLELFQLKRRFIQASIDAAGGRDIRIEGPMAGHDV